MTQTQTIPRRYVLALATLLFSGCEDGDFDLRGQAGVLDTSDVAQAARVPRRPLPDERGVVRYPAYDVVEARPGDTINDIAGRVGQDPFKIAAYNGLPADKVLQGREIIALPQKVDSTVATAPDGSVLTPTIVDVAELAPPEGPFAPDAAATDLAAGGPLRHRVEAGETAFTIARLYDVPVQSLAEYNSLDSSLSVRQGQVLLIPVVADGPATASAPIALSAPGQGSVPPPPPSSTGVSGGLVAGAAGAVAAAPPPVVPLQPATDASAEVARFSRPVPGSIIRDFNPGTNDGVDFAASPGETVKAAGDGTVAVITEDTNGVKIIALKHDDNLFTIYANVDGISVAKGDTIQRGQPIAQVAKDTPAFLHFEVLKGLNAVDPNDYI